MEPMWVPLPPFRASVKLPTSYIKCLVSDFIHYFYRAGTLGKIIPVNKRTGLKTVLEAMKTLLKSEDGKLIEIHFSFIPFSSHDKIGLL